jgi:hypothetical protein
VEEANAFVTSLDPSRRWFRYHQLSGWFVANGFAVEVIRHAQAAGTGGWPPGCSSLVMRRQSIAHQGDVLRDERGTRVVTGRDGPHQARHQAELAAEHPMHHEHVTCVGERLCRHRHFLLSFPRSARCSKRW